MLFLGGILIITYPFNGVRKGKELELLLIMRNRIKL